MFAALAHSRRSHAQSSRHSEVTLLGKIPLGETRAWGKLALGITLDWLQEGRWSERVRMETLTWLLVLFGGAAILLLVVLILYLV